MYRRRIASFELPEDIADGDYFETPDGTMVVVSQFQLFALPWARDRIYVHEIRSGQVWTQKVLPLKRSILQRHWGREWRIRPTEALFLVPGDMIPYFFFDSEENEWGEVCP